MSEKPPMDRRIRRTRQMLSSALLDLIAEQGYEATSVQDIAARANVGRATFYLHYHDKEQLLTDSLLGLFEDLTHYVELDRVNPVTNQTLSVLVFQHVAQQHRLYQALLKEEGPPFIMKLLRDHLAELIQRYVLAPLIRQSDQSPKIDPTLLAIHAAGSLLALITWWLNHQLSPDASEMGQIFWRLIATGIDSVLEIKHV